MKKFIFKVGSLVLALLMISTTLIACKKNGDTGSETSNDGVINTVDPSGETYAWVPNLPDVNYSGSEFTIYYHGPDWDPGALFYDEAQAGSLVNDEVLKRNTTVEAKYGIKFVFIPITSTPNTDYQAFSNILSSGESFDAAWALDNMALARSGMLLNLYDVMEYSEGFKGEWWMDQITDTMTISGKAYGLMNNITNRQYDQMSCILANKDMINSISGNDFNDIYDMVENGTWTIDKMMEYAKNGATKDLNGDSVMDKNDSFGFVHREYANNLLSAVGGDFVAKDANGKYYYSLDENIDILLATSQKVIQSADTYITYDNGTGQMSEDMMKDKRVMFLAASMSQIHKYKDIMDLGVLPMPKFDETQENYRDSTSLWGVSFFCVPTTVIDTQKTAIIIEAMAMESQSSTYWAYIEQVLKTRYAADPRAPEVTDIALKGLYLSPLDGYKWYDNDPFLRDELMSGKTAFASKIEGKAAAIQNLMDSDYKLFAEMPY